MAQTMIMAGKCKDDLERKFYLRMTRKFGWTKKVLALQIENKTYEKTLTTRQILIEPYRRKFVTKQNWL